MNAGVARRGNRSCRRLERSLNGHWTAACQPLAHRADGVIVSRAHPTGYGAATRSPLNQPAKPLFFWQSHVSASANAYPTHG